MFKKDEKETKKAVVVLSGGMDSTTLLYDVKNLGYDVYALSFDYGQKHVKELVAARNTCDKLGIPHKILNIQVLNEVAPSALTRKDWNVPEGHYEAENMKQTVVPNRNMVMLSLATSYAISIKAESLWIGAHSGDHAIYPDCRKSFLLALKEAIALCDWHKISLEAPYVEMSKGDIVKRGVKLGVDYSLTWSCYKGDEKACGKCGTCVERLEAMEYAGTKDPIEYEVSNNG